MLAQSVLRILLTVTMVSSKRPQENGIRSAIFWRPCFRILFPLPHPNLQRGFGRWVIPCTVYHSAPLNFRTAPPDMMTVGTKAESGTKEERKAQITQNAADMWILLYSWTNHPWFAFVPNSFHASGLQFWQRASPQLWVLLRGSDISSCRERNATGPFLRNTVASSGLVC